MKRHAEALRLAREGPVSIALLHRRLGCGYAEAARLLELLRIRGLA